MTDTILERLGATRKPPPHRHQWGWQEWLEPDGQSWVLGMHQVCRCGAVKDPVVSRRGTNNRKRGNAYELAVAKRLGLRRTGMYGGADDAKGDHMTLQVKVGGMFPETIWRWLSALPRDADRIRAVVIGDAPGPGGRRREVIVFDLSEWTEWHGEG